jgi:hypothetical protein
MGYYLTADTPLSMLGPRCGGELEGRRDGGYRRRGAFPADGAPLTPLKLAAKNSEAITRWLYRVAASRKSGLGISGMRAGRGWPDATGEPVWLGARPQKSDAPPPADFSPRSGRRDPHGRHSRCMSCGQAGRQHFPTFLRARRVQKLPQGSRHPGGRKPQLPRRVQQHVGTVIREYGRAPHLRDERHRNFR